MDFLLDTAIKAALLLALGHLVIVACRRFSAGNRHILAAAFLLATALLPLLSIAMPKQTLELLPSTPVVERIRDAAVERIASEVMPQVVGIADADATPEAEWGGDIVVGDVSLPEGERSTVGSVPVATISSASSGSASAVISDFSRLSAAATAGAILFAVWLIGALFIIGRLVLGVGRVIWLRSRATEAPAEVARLSRRVADRFGIRAPAVVVSDSSDVPFVCGLFSAAIVLPSHSLGWERERLTAVMTHEMAHVKRRDCYTLLLGRLTVAVHWFNPLAWTLEKESRRLCERACDDVVLRQGEAPSRYASHILEIARGLPEHDNLTSVALAVSRKSEIEGRLMAILHPSIGRRVVSRRGALAICSAVLLVAMTAATFQLAASPSEPAAALSGSATEPGATITVTPGAPSGDEECCVEPADRDRYIGVSKKERKRNGRNHYEIGWKLHRSGDYASAIENFREAAAWGYRPATSWYNVACGYARMGAEQNALRALERAIDLGWDDHGHMNEDRDLHSIHGTAGYTALAERVVAECEAEKANAVPLSGEVAALVEAVSSEIRESGSAFSFTVDEINEVAYQFLSAGELDDGLTTLREAVRRSDGTSTRALYNMACAYAMAGKEEESLDWLERALEQGLDRLDLLRGDEDLDSIRDHERFEELMTRAEALSVSSVTAHGFGKHSRKESWQLAADEWGRYLVDHPRSGRAWSNLGFAHYHLGELRKAEKAFIRALQFGYQPGATSYNIASTHAQRDNVDAAFHWLEKAADAGFDVGDQLSDDDDFRQLRRDDRARRYVSAGAWVAPRPSTREESRAQFAASSGSSSRASMAPLPAAAAVAGASQSMAPLPPSPPLPPLPPLPPFMSGVNESMVLVRGDSMIVNTHDDDHLSANMNGERTTVTYNGRKYRFETDHLLIFPLGGEMWITKDREIVERALKMWDMTDSRAVVRELRRDAREIERDYGKLRREYEQAKRRESHAMSRLERVRNSEDRRELRSDIEEYREDQEEALEEIDELMEDREELQRAIEKVFEKVEGEREERREELEELMKLAIEKGGAERLR